MIGLINEIKLVYKYFNNENYISFALFLLAVIFIFIKEENKKVKDFFVWYTLIILLVIWNPFCIYILNKFINFGSMYRIYFMLPTIFTIAYAFVKLVENEGKVKKFISVVLISFTVIITGPCICNKYNMVKVNNYYKLPDDDVEIAKIISDDNTTNYKKAMVPYGMSSKIRQIDSEILLAYSRIITNKVDENGNPLPEDTDNPFDYEPVKNMNEGNVEYITDYCKQNLINYVVINKFTQLTGNMEENDFYLYNETENYYIYKMDIAK